MKQLVLSVFLFLIFGLTSETYALSVVSTKDKANVVTGDNLVVDVSVIGSVAGGPPSIGAFDIDVQYNPAFLRLERIEFGIDLGFLPFEALTNIQLFELDGILDIAEVSLLSPAELDVLQPADFSIVWIEFIAIQNSEPTIKLPQVLLVDAFGNDLVNIPEPSTLLLIGSALVAIIGIRRKSYLRRIYR